MSLSIDGLSGQELARFDAWKQAEALNELCAELGKLGEIRKRCAQALYDAKIGLLSSPSIENKELLLRAQAALERVKVELSTRREQTKILQSLLRATP